MYKRYLKRLIDICLSLIFIIFFIWVYIIIYILVFIKLGKPVIFCQYRPGKKNIDGKERIFRMYKFRTMVDLRDKQGNLLPDEYRLTKFGSFLRETSLDEFPEIFNVLIGDMSFIGPRPQLIKDLVFMTDEQKDRHNVLPGITGLAQVNGRNSITWEDKFRYDLEYVNNYSFKFDYIILLKTIGKVLIKDGINAEGFKTAEDYGDYLLRNSKISISEYDVKIKEASRIINEKF